MEQLSLLGEDIDSLCPDLMGENFTYQEVEYQLEKHLRKELAQFELKNIELPDETNVNAKWRYSSAMQKSIRRGYVEDSIKYALVYNRLDSTAFWRRIVVVAFEDIGVAGVWEVALTLMAASSKVWRKKVGGDAKVIQYIVRTLALSVKDRTVCDCFYALSHYPVPYEHLERLEKCNHAMLSELILYKHPPALFKKRYENITLQTLAAWMLWGTDKYENRMLPFRTGSRELFFSTMNQMNMPGLVKYITIRGMTACGYAMNLSYPFIWRMLRESHYEKIIETNFPSKRFYINGLPEEAFDKHELHGRNSLAYFVNTCPMIKEFLKLNGIVRRNEVIASVGTAVFNCEGALLDKKLVFEGVDEIYELTECSDFLEAGLSPELGRNLTGMIQAYADVLRHARIQEVTGVPNPNPLSHPLLNPKFKAKGLIQSPDELIQTLNSHKPMNPDCGG